jgi:hypothetical protein
MAANPSVRLSLEAVPEVPADPWDQEGPRAAFACTICIEVGYEEFSNSDTFVDVLDKPLKDALLTPKGYICSRRCMSQLMFQSADKAQQEKLLRLDRALAEIAETAPDLIAMLEEWEIECNLAKLCRKAGEARSALGYDSRYRPMPKWMTESEAPEDALKWAIRDAVHTLGWTVVTDLKVKIAVELSKIGNPDYQHQKADPYRTGSTARILATIGNAMLRLKAAEKGEAIA